MHDLQREKPCFFHSQMSGFSIVFSLTPTSFLSNSNYTHTHISTTPTEALNQLSAHQALKAETDGVTGTHESSHQQSHTDNVEMKRCCAAVCAAALFFPYELRMCTANAMSHTTLFLKDRLDPLKVINKQHTVFEH